MKNSHHKNKIEKLFLKTDLNFSINLSLRINHSAAYAHNIAYLRAIESQLFVSDPLTEYIRNIISKFEIIDSHLDNLILKIAPSTFANDNILDFSKGFPTEMRNYFQAKKIINQTLILLGVNKEFLVPIAIGKKLFLNNNQIKKIISASEELEIIFKNLWEFFSKMSLPKMIRPVELLALSENSDEFISSRGKKFCISNTFSHLSKNPKNSGYQLEKNEYLVGPIARLNINKIDRKTSENIKKTTPKISINNLFEIIPARIIESQNLLSDILEKISNYKESIKTKTPSPSEIGVCNSSDGIIIYRVKLEKNNRQIKEIQVIDDCDQNNLAVEIFLKEIEKIKKKDFLYKSKLLRSAFNLE
jgi:coenzyme F420-reducing hydrogenase alpha subunit